MNFSKTSWYRLSLTAAAAGLFAAGWLAGTTRARAGEDTNPLNSVLGFVGMQFDKEDELIDYRARAPIVVPPRLELPKPKEAARDPSWPKDPDVAAQRRAALDSRRPAPQVTPNTRVEMSQQELDKGRAPLPEEGPPDECLANSGTSSLCLYTPWKMLKSMTNVLSKDTVEPGPEPVRKFLTEPPAGYRQATDVAKATIDPPKDKPDTADAGAFIRSQRPKTSVSD
ncbi:MAG: hypothetical protein L0Y57_12630 [Beijerinckiaceae bacterium]|nr:hypothetical protein [Beijerinckiaceae bacterium]